MLPGQPAPVLELLAGDKPLTATVAGNFSAHYVPVIPSTLNLTVRQAGDQTGSIKRLSANLKADDFITVLVTSKTGQPDAELINDTVDPKATDSRRLTVRQLSPDIKATTFIGSSPVSTALGFGETATLDNVPAGPSTLTIQTVIPGKGPKSWSMPLDMTQTPHATLLIFPDPYGRFRPRLAIDARADVRGRDDSDHH